MKCEQAGPFFQPGAKHQPEHHDWLDIFDQSLTHLPAKRILVTDTGASTKRTPFTEWSAVCAVRS
jgi:hypothetical protein